MRRVLITGGSGFLGRNLTVHLREHSDYEVRVFEVSNSQEELREWLRDCDIVFHLAGVNRPKDTGEFETGNVGLTEEICRILLENGSTPKIVFSSSIQADLENPYGLSKKRAEAVLRQFGLESGACIRIYRLKNLFGKWSRPNYNSVTATFCNNIAHDLPISISDPCREIELSYVDDVVAAFLTEIESCEAPSEQIDIPSSRLTLGDLAGRIQSFHDMRHTLMAPDFADLFNRALYSTYLSYVPAESLRQQLTTRSDVRGSLAEFIKSSHFGQIFVSRTKPGVTRGNHYHHTKSEKFFVVEGDGLIRMRPVGGGPVQQYLVKGSAYDVVDIPPGMTHSITNVGDSEMITLFWSSEVFNPDRPDTYYLAV